MRHAEKKKEKDKIAIALMLCFCVIALTSIFTIRSNISKMQHSTPDPQIHVSDSAAAENPPGSSTEEKDAAASTALQKDKTEETAQSGLQVPTVDSRKEQGSSMFCFPVNAPDAFVSNPFSMDRLVYSVTLDQYMTHCGVDIEAPADTQVQAIADGTVTAVYVDDRYGNSVEIVHTPQFTAIYSNLSDAHMVETGDTVTAGQIIGGVGTTGLFESLESAHLHLELVKDGSYVDPLDYIPQ